MNRPMLWTAVSIFFLLWAPLAAAQISGLNMVKYLVSRAQENLERMGDDPGGHYSRAQEYLRKAGEELNQIPSS